MTEYRTLLHKELIEKVIRLREDNIPNYCDKHSKSSVVFGKGIYEQIYKGIANTSIISAQTSGKKFEEIVLKYLNDCFITLKQLRPGDWRFERNTKITDFDQYNHLAELASIINLEPELEASLGRDYIINPDIVIYRMKEGDDLLNKDAQLVDNISSTRATIRYINSFTCAKILHASISCKYSIRSDRSQNSRTEALNLIRNRKGRAPNIDVVTAEPLPSRIASIALGTGDIDCVYHIALHELINTIKTTDRDDSYEMINTMVNGKRLKDISDLPLDLII
jgi:hypothetical protein